MNLFVFILLTVSVCWHRTCCEIVITTDRLKMIPSPTETSITKSIENTTEKQYLWKNLFPKENSSTIQELKKVANVKTDPSNRRSKILGSLSFLTGISVSDLTSEQPPSVKTVTKFHPVAVNLGTTRVSPQIAAIYNPYPYLTHPYVMTAPLGFYPLWDPLQLQSLAGVHNNFQSIPDNKRIDASNNNDQYVDEVKKVENVKVLNESAGNAEDTMEIEVDDDQNIEEKMMTSDIACAVRKKMNAQQIAPPRDISKKHGDGDTQHLANLHTKSKTKTDNETANTTMNIVQNSTDNYNYTGHPFYGYYDGYPQSVNHIDLTTETTDYKYHEYDHVNYNLPSYDKPVNFYSDQRYNYYSVPSDPYLPNQFHQEQIPEYFSNDFKRYVYTPDNTASFSNSDFRPVT